MQRIGLFVAAVAILGASSVVNAAAEEPDTVLGMLSSIIDDTTCGDGIGRTFRTDTLLSAARNDDAHSFFMRYESCAGAFGRAAEAGLTPLLVGLTAQCSGPVELPGRHYEWIICDLGFIPLEGMPEPIHVELSEFGLMTGDDQRIAPYTTPDLYQGQMHDMSRGLDITGPDPTGGVVAFQVHPGQVEAPFLIGWGRSGDFIIADELEPETAEFFIRDMQP